MVMEYAVSVCQVSRMKVKKFQDTAAQSIRFGVEVETMIPRTAQVAVGGYGLFAATKDICPVSLSPPFSTATMG